VERQKASFPQVETDPLLLSQERRTLPSSFTDERSGSELPQRNRRQLDSPAGVGVSTERPWGLRVGRHCDTDSSRRGFCSSVRRHVTTSQDVAIDGQRSELSENTGFPVESAVHPLVGDARRTATNASTHARKRLNNEEEITQSVSRLAARARWNAPQWPVSPESLLRGPRAQWGANRATRSLRGLGVAPVASS
jgi:hypothetical protein